MNKAEADIFSGTLAFSMIQQMARVNTGVYVSFQLRFSQGVCPVVGLLEHMVDLLLAFKGISILFSIVDVSVYISTNRARRFPFLHTLSSVINLKPVIQTEVSPKGKKKFRLLMHIYGVWENGTDVSTCRAGIAM